MAQLYQNYLAGGPLTYIEALFSDMLGDTRKARQTALDFYGKSGFRQASEYGIRYHGLPEGEDASFFLCKELIPGFLDGITGEYATPEGYLVDEQEVEEFDRQLTMFFSIFK